MLVLPVMDRDGVCIYGLEVLGFLSCFLFLFLFLFLFDVGVGVGVVLMVGSKFERK